ncbi:helix-turn-helix domain-containing protein [Streptomyces sp. NPDC058195]|uniref:helix-turn-helix domain-containing protein n=1 Tax=Streptomyces sp. NPDC058195 TaxID=3346375 RepID=UPI0036EF078A
MTAVAHRRARVRQLAQTGASNRQIAAQLGISKDTVRRDLLAPLEPVEPMSERLARRAAQTEKAMRQLSAAAQALDAARPAYTPTDDVTARRWHSELRAISEQLVAHAGAFADYYPSATDPVPS